MGDSAEAEIAVGCALSSESELSVGLLPDPESKMVSQVQIPGRRRSLSTASMRSVRLSEATSVFDKYLIVPILAFAYCIIVGPL